MARERTPKAWPRLDRRTADRPRAQRRWEVVYDDALTFRRRTKGGFSTKTSAQAWATNYMADTARGGYRPPSTERTFQVAADEWFASRTKLKPRTRESYAVLIGGKNSRLRNAFQAAVIANIRAEDVEGFVRSLQEAGCSSSTIRNNVAVLRAVLTREVKARRIPFNPAFGVELPPVRRPQDYDKVRYDLTPEDVDAMCAALPWPYDVLVRLAAYSGLRAGELAGLRTSDVDLETQTLSVQRVVVDLNGRLTIDQPKTASSVRVVSVAPVVDELREHIIRLQREAAAAADLPLFPGLMTGRRNADPAPRLDFSKHLRHSAWYGRYWKDGLAVAHVPASVRFHDLRHANATWLLNEGVSMHDIGQHLGHSSEITTARYAHRDSSARLTATATALANRRASASPLDPADVIPLWRDRR